MSTSHKLYIKQINLEQEVVQPMYYIGWLAMEDVDIFSQDVLSFSCT